MKYFSNLRAWGLKKSILVLRIIFKKKLFIFRERLLHLGKPGRSYSQHAEDLYIDRYLKYPSNGFYVDVGANHPTTFSNTLRFYERGWRGINIEPDVANFQLLQSARPNDLNLNIGISDCIGKLIFFVCKENTLSTFSKETASRLRKEGYPIIAEKEVPVQTLSSVLSREHIGRIDFMSVDTEGHDSAVLRSNNWQVYRPRIICVEDSTGYEHDEFFKTKKYRKIANSGLNSFFVDETKE